MKRSIALAVACCGLVGVSWAAEMVLEAGVPDFAQPDSRGPEDSSLAAPVGDPDWHDRERLTGGWWGARSALSDRGIAIDANLTADFSKNLHGGIDTSGSSLLQLYNVYFTLDTERLLQLKGGTLFVVFQNQSGQSPEDEVGSFSGVSSIDADGRTQVSEIYYEQAFADDRLTIKLGKIDVTADFAYSEFGGAFVGASLGTSPNMPIPTYPDPSFGGSGRLKIAETYYVAGGVYDGAAQEGVRTGSRGPKSLWGSPSDLFLVIETGAEYDCGDGQSGRLAIGAWRHTGTFDRFDGGTEKGTNGVYLALDHVLYKEVPADDANEQGLSVFTLYSYADPAVSEAPHHLSCGLVYRGLFPTRDDDLIGLGTGWSHFADQAGFGSDAETVVEIFYEFRPMPSVSIKPDLQYYVNAGGERDALVATIRCELEL